MSLWRSRNVEVQRKSERKAMEGMLRGDTPDSRLWDHLRWLHPCRMWKRNFAHRVGAARMERFL